MKDVSSFVRYMEVNLNRIASSDRILRVDILLRSHGGMTKLCDINEVALSWFVMESILRALRQRCHWLTHVEVERTSRSLLVTFDQNYDSCPHTLCLWYQ